RITTLRLSDRISNLQACTLYCSSACALPGAGRSHYCCISCITLSILRSRVRQVSSLLCYLSTGLLVHHSLEMPSSFDESKAGSVTFTPSSSVASFDLHSLNFLHSSDGASTAGTAVTEPQRTIVTAEYLDEMEHNYINQISALLDAILASGDPNIFDVARAHLHFDQFPSSTLREIRAFNGPDPILRPPVAPTPAVVLDLPTRSRPKCPHCGSHTHKAARCWFLSQPGDAPGSFVLPNMTPAQLTRFSSMNHPALPQGVVLISGTFNPTTNTFAKPVPKASISTKHVPETSGSAPSRPANGRGLRRQNKTVTKHMPEASGSATIVPEASGPATSGRVNGRGRNGHNKTFARLVLEASGSATTAPEASRSAASGRANEHGRRRFNKPFAKPVPEVSGSATTGPEAPPLASESANERGRRRFNKNPRA
ncbi:hypothetical protein EDB81DRAFT_398398, partial [Dactylonectria macrodidyma]